MTRLCTLSPSALAAVTPADLATPARTAALCARSSARPSIGRSPNNTVTGNCGYSYIYGYNDGGGWAKVSVGIGVVAPIAYGSATIHYRIHTQNLVVVDNLGPDAWGDVVYHHTGVGWQTAWLDADVILTNGDICSSGHPTTRYYVS